MVPLSRLTRAKRELKPLEQGDLDNLCGLYSVINAVRLVVYPDQILTQGELGRLFERGLSTLGHKRKLKMTVAYGIDHALWLLMCRAVIEEAETLLPRRIAIGPLVSEDLPWRTRDVVRDIKRAVGRDRPVLVCLAGRLNHWSVIVSWSAMRFHLFDSAGYHWISISSLTASAQSSNRAHIVTREGTIVVSGSALCGVGG